MLQAIWSPAVTGSSCAATRCSCVLLSAGTHPGLFQYTLNFQNEITAIRQHLTSLGTVLSSMLHLGLQVHEVSSGHFLLIPALYTMPNTGYLIKTFRISIHHVHLVANFSLPVFQLAGAVADFHLSQAPWATGSTAFLPDSTPGLGNIPPLSSSSSRCRKGLVQRSEI